MWSLKRLTTKGNQIGIIGSKRSFTVQMQRLDVTPTNLRDSVNRMLDAYPVSSSGSIADCDDACHYCKLPNALAMAGRMDDCDRMLDLCVRSFLCENGDFRNNPAEKTLHWEFEDFYPYLNQWWITAGMRLGRFDFVGKAYNYCDKYWFNPKTNAQVVQDALNQNPDGYNEHCIFNSAHMGYTQLFMGNIRKAKAIGHTIIKMVEKQPNMDETGNKLKFYQRFNDDFELLTSFPDGHRGVKLAAIIKGNEPGQCWWSLGYPVAYLTHLYTYTG